MLGESAGRARGNPAHGRRRMSDEERAQHTHMKDDPQQWPGELTDEERPRSSLKRKFFTFVIVLGNCLFVTFLSWCVSQDVLVTRWIHWPYVILIAYTVYLVRTRRDDRRP